MAELKTQPNKASAIDFLNKIADEQRRGDCFKVMEMMKSAAKAEPMMWGSSIVGFGNRRYVYASGRELDWFAIGFSPRKGDLTIYLAGGLEPQRDLLEQLGKFKTGKGCLYIHQLNDVQTPVLQKIFVRSVKSAAEPISHVPTKPRKTQKRKRNKPQ